MGERPAPKKLQPISSERFAAEAGRRMRDERIGALPMGKTVEYVGIGIEPDVGRKGMRYR